MPDDVNGETQFVRFWNEILVPKFIAFKHILVDGLTHHSEAVSPTLKVKEGDNVLDVGCAFGDTATKLAMLFAPEYNFIFSALAPCSLTIPWPSCTTYAQS